MAIRKPLVLNGGQIEQLQAGDVLDAVVAQSDSVGVTNGNASPIVIGAPVYIKAADQVDLAKADAQGTVQVLGLIKDASIASSAAGNAQTGGVLSATTAQWDAITGDVGGLTANAIYWLSASTAGKLTRTAPTTVGQFVVRVGIALSTTELKIEPEAPIKL
jgi:hypothetical protein